MAMIKFKDVAHLYLGAKCKWKVMGDDQWKDGIIDLKVLDKLFDRQPFEIKPLFRLLKDFQPEDFKKLFADQSIFHFGTSNWYGAYLDNEDIERSKQMEAFDLLEEYEDADNDNVLCYCTHNTTFCTGGLSEEYFYSLPIPEYADIINKLRAMGFDCDNLIKNGEAQELQLTKCDGCSKMYYEPAPVKQFGSFNTCTACKHNPNITFE